MTEMWEYEDRRYRRALRLKLGSLVGAAGGVISGIMGAGAASDAAKAQQQAGQQAIAGLNNANTQVQQQYSPYTTAGKSALSALTGDLQNGTGFASPFNFQADPGYNFTLRQGQNAINANAAAKGLSLSGGAQKALAAYTSGLANQTYNDAYNRYLQGSQLQYNQLSGVAGMGLNATNSAAQSNLSTAQQVANAQEGIGNAQAAGIIGRQNAYNSIFGAAGNAAQGFSLNNSLSANPIKVFGQVL